MIPFLRGEGIKKLDGFMVSHNDADHSGGAASVLAQLPVNWLASSFDTTALSVEKRSIKCVAGQYWVWDKVTFEVLYPKLASYQDAGLTDNNKSCVVKVTSQFGSLLLTGDIEKEAENSLLNDALQANSDKGLVSEGLINKSPINQLKSDILIAPHHGSKTSSTVEFVQAVGAKHIIFTVGYLNRFKHPKPLIEKRYEESGALTYRSDYQGALTINFMQATSVSIKALRQSQPRYWHDKY